MSKPTGQIKAKSNDPITYFVVERGKEKVLKTRGFKQLGRMELVLPTADVNAGVKVLTRISAKILNNEINIKNNQSIIGVLKVPLFMRTGIFDGEEVMYLVTR